MNKQQRKRIKVLIGELQELVDSDDLTKENGWRDTLSDIIDELEALSDEEQEKFDNLPDNLIFSSKADEYQNAIDALQEALCSVNDAYAEDITGDAVNDMLEAIGILEPLL